MNSVAAQYGRPLFTADVSQTFLRGVTFEQAALSSAVKVAWSDGVVVVVRRGEAREVQLPPRHRWAPRHRRRGRRRLQVTNYQTITYQAPPPPPLH